MLGLPFFQNYPLHTSFGSKASLQNAERLSLTPPEPKPKSVVAEASLGARQLSDELPPLIKDTSKPSHTLHIKLKNGVPEKLEQRARDLNLTDKNGKAKLLQRILDGRLEIERVSPSPIFRPLTDRYAETSLYVDISSEALEGIKELASQGGYEGPKTFLNALPTLFKSERIKRVKTVAQPKKPPQRSFKMEVNAYGSLGDYALLNQQTLSQFFEALGRGGYRLTFPEGVNAPVKVSDDNGTNCRIPLTNAQKAALPAFAQQQGYEKISYFLAALSNPQEYKISDPGSSATAAVFDVSG